jgi:hypothetical protein
MDVDIEPGDWPVEGVARVLEQRLGQPPDVAREQSERLLEIFHADTTIEDTEVESDERELLWDLMLAGLVTMETQHRPHPDHGRMWRYFYWHLVPPERLEEEDQEGEEEPTVYDELPASAWRDRATA